jgi:hypothetical protein
MSLPIFHMSETGACPKVLTAKMLRYESKEQTTEDLERLKHYSRCEALAAAQIEDAGFHVEGGELCQKCKDEYGLERYGIHIEVETPFFILTGHLDRRAHLDNALYPVIPVEIKSLGKASFNRFSKSGFAEFPEYEHQEACYLHHEGTPGMYWCMNRDTGESLRYIINDKNDKINLPGFQKITLNTSFDDVSNKLNDVILDASEKKLPDVQLGGKQCMYCNFTYLCDKDSKGVVTLDLPKLIQASQLYLNGDDMIKQGEHDKDEATQILLNHSKVNKEPKFRVGGISFSYQGMTSKTSWDGVAIRQDVPEEQWRKWYKAGKPYEGYTIRKVKGSEE